MADTLNRKLQDGYDELLHAGRQMEQRGREIQEEVHRSRGVTRIHPEPTARVDLTEDELLLIQELLFDDPNRPESGNALAKMAQLLAIESGPGGSFYDGGDAA